MTSCLLVHNSSLVKARRSEQFSLSAACCLPIRPASRVPQDCLFSTLS